MSTFGNAFVSQRSLDLPNEDFIFHGIIRPLRVVSKPFHRLVYKVQDLSGIEFDMSVMDGFAMNNKTVCGTFRNDAKRQTIVLESEFMHCTQALVKEFLLSKMSLESIRARYEKLYDSLSADIEAHITKK